MRGYRELVVRCVCEEENVTCVTFSNSGCLFSFKKRSLSSRGCDLKEGEKFFVKGRSGNSDTDLEKGGIVDFRPAL